MNIDLKEIKARDLTNGYEDNEEDGVLGYSGKLDIRPPYQREFIYKDKQRNAVINTITKDFPLNVMYWDMGKLEAAEKEFRQAVKLNQDSEKSSLGLFHVLWDQDKKDEAIEEMKRFTTIAKSEDCKAILKEISSKK